MNAQTTPRHRLHLSGLGLILGAGALCWRMDLPGSEHLQEIRTRVQAPLQFKLAQEDLRFGAPVYLRLFKESKELELWMEREKGARWTLFHTWPIANHSGTLGPKLREGDLQAPEGFYDVTLAQLNPLSRFHLSFNIGYPNACDRHHGRTGSLIMVHGGHDSVGCFAMTDPVIEVIYLLVEAALHGGQCSVPVHVFPFRMTAERMDRTSGDAWEAFWRDELKPAYDAFETNRKPPRIVTRSGRYHLDAL